MLGRVSFGSGSDCPTSAPAPRVARSAALGVRGAVVCAPAIGREIPDAEAPDLISLQRHRGELGFKLCGIEVGDTPADVVGLIGGIGGKHREAAGISSRRARHRKSAHDRFGTRREVEGDLPGARVIGFVADRAPKRVYGLRIAVLTDKPARVGAGVPVGRNAIVLRLGEVGSPVLGRPPTSIYGRYGG